MSVVLQGGSTVIQGGITRIMPNIVEDGLVLFFDPNDNNSYPGSGTSVTNIAPDSTNNGISGTLDDTAMYINPGGSDAAYFRVRSDSVIQRLDFSGTVTRNANQASTLQFFFWSNYNANGQYGNSQAFFGGKFTNYMALESPSSDATTYRPEAETNGGSDGNHDYFARPSDGEVFATGSWSSWTSVFNNTTGSNYFNGNLNSTTYPLVSDSVHSFSRLGSNSTGTDSGARGGDIRMGALLVYNRALSEEEIKQNLKVLDRRFS